MFGRRKISADGTATFATPERALPTPPVDSDGKRRVFGEAVFAEHGDLLRNAGIKLNDSSNILPDQAAVNRMVLKSAEAQNQRRVRLEVDMHAKHGCNNIRPFFLCSKAFFKSPVGMWLMLSMRMLPFDDWNTLYLPMDRPTSLALGLPLHPQQDLWPMDEIMSVHVSDLHAKFMEEATKSRQDLEVTGDFDALRRFNVGVERMREDLLEWLEGMTPLVIQVIADFHEKGKF